MNHARGLELVQPQELNLLFFMKPWVTTKKSLKLVCHCHQLLSEFLVKSHSPRVSGQSRLSTNDNEMIPGDMHRSPGIYLTAEENLAKPQLGDRRSVIASHWIPNLQMRSVGSHNVSGSEKEGKLERSKRTGNIYVTKDV